ncbi:hypothetical protein SAY86_005777 [Trapa natans]|uniref:Uncharacterized protein n=1 Tax=Trapa natans TaxID=22666 RepID=A0AAN7L423_TRANT|nr:hypothetical protein SAY86_005777 [Trapa natans]
MMLHIEKRGQYPGRRKEPWLYMNQNYIENLQEMIQAEILSCLIPSISNSYVKNPILLRRRNQRRWRRHCRGRRRIRWLQALARQGRRSSGAMNDPRMHTTGKSAEISTDPTLAWKTTTPRRSLGSRGRSTCGRRGSPAGGRGRRRAMRLGGRRGGGWRSGEGDYEDNGDVKLHYKS